MHQVGDAICSGFGCATRRLRLAGLFQKSFKRLGEKHLTTPDVNSSGHLNLSKSETISSINNDPRDIAKWIIPLKPSVKHRPTKYRIIVAYLDNMRVFLHCQLQVATIRSAVSMAQSKTILHQFGHTSHVCEGF